MDSIFRGDSFFFYSAYQHPSPACTSRFDLLETRPSTCTSISDSLDLGFPVDALYRPTRRKSDVFLHCFFVFSTALPWLLVHYGTTKYNKMCMPCNYASMQLSTKKNYASMQRKNVNEI